MGNAAKAISFSNGPSLTDAEFEEARELVYKLSGLDLGDGKGSLIAGRIGPIVTRDGYRSFSDYLKAVKSDPSGRLRSEFVDRLATNHTFFHREPEHFDFFVQTAMPETIKDQTKKGKTGVRIWCAASSTGQEPYTLAMLMLQALGPSRQSWDTGILATDISSTALATAKEGRYPSDTIQRLPNPLQRFFEPAGAGNVAVTAHIKKEVTYRRFNLLNERYPFKQQFDSVFCRNVMIYFDNDTRRSVVGKMLGVTRVGGYLFVGAAEAIPPGFNVTQVAASVYRKEG